MWEQPVLTANGTIGQSEFAVSSGGGADNTAWKAFDGNDSTYCNKTNADSWLSFYSKTPLEITAIEIYCVDNYLPRKGIFQVSYDEGYTWEQVGTWEDDSCLTAQINLDNGKVNGQYFRFYCQEKCTKSGNSGISRITITADITDTWTYKGIHDIKRTLINNPRSLSHYVPFIDSSTKDLCGNEWTLRYSDPIISNNRLILDGTDYIRSNINTSIFNSDFTIHFWMTYKDTKTSEGGFFTCDNEFALQCYNSKVRFNARDKDTNTFYTLDSIQLAQFKNTNHHFAVVRKDNTLSFFFDGVLSTSYTVGNFVEGNTVIYIGKRGSNLTNLEMDHFSIHTSALWTENFEPPIEENDYNILQNKIIYLPFNNSPTEDLCGNEWTKSISGIQETNFPYKYYMLFEGNNYLKSSSNFNFTGQDFTIECYFSATSNTSGGSVCLWQLYNSSSKRFQLSITTDKKLLLWKESDSVNISTSFSVLDGKLHHAVSIFKENIWYLFLDNVLIGTKSHVPSSVSYQIYIGVNFSASKYYTGYINNFKIFNFCGFLINNTFDIEKANKVSLLVSGVCSNHIDMDIQRVCNNVNFANKYAKVYLPFNNSITEDLCGNYWKQSGTTLVLTENNSLQFDGNSYLYCKHLLLGGQDFTIRFYFSFSSSNGSWPRIFSLFNTIGSDADCIDFRRDSKSNNFYCEVFATSSSKFTLSYDTLYCLEWNYSHSEALSRIFINGKLKATVSKSISLTKFTRNYIGRSEYTADAILKGLVDEFIIFDGVTLHKQDFDYPDTIDWSSIQENIQPKPFLPQYLYFSGSSGCYGKFPLGLLSGNTTFTMEAKLSTTSTVSNDNNYLMPTIFGVEISNNDVNDFGLCVNGGKIAYWAEPNFRNGQNAKYVTECKINDGKIHNISLVSEVGKYIKIYCDGVLIHQNDNYNITIPYNTAFYVGSNTTSAAPLEMSLYEARFWSKALTEEEIFADIDGTEEGLEAWYKGSEIDLSGKNRNITLNSVQIIKPLTDLVQEKLDISRKIQNRGTWLNNYLKVYLPFNNSITEDLYGNTWIENGNPSLSETKVFCGKSLHLDGASYLKLNSSLTLGGKDFTISGWAKINSNIWYSGIIAINNKRIRICGVQTYTDRLLVSILGNETTIQSLDLTKPFHFEIDYHHSSQLWQVFFNGKIIRSYTANLNSTVYDTVLIGSNGDSTAYYWDGEIDEFIILNGIALHKENFDAYTNCMDTKITFSPNSSFFDFLVDIKYNTKNYPYGIKVYLPFDNSIVEDLCDNEWISFYEPIIYNRSLQTDGINYLEMKETITLGGKDFTISGWFNILNIFGNYNSIFTLFKTEDSDIDTITLQTKTSSTTMQFVCFNTTNQISIINNIFHHFAITYSHRSTLVCLYIDGTKIVSFTKEIPETEFILQISHSNYMNYHGFVGLIKSFIINDDVVIWKDNFIIPDTDYYIGLNMKVKNIISTTVDFQADIQITCTNGSDLNKYLISYLPFDTSPTEDLCGNVWEIGEGTVTVGENNSFNSSSLQLDGTGYIKANSLIILGSQDFTIDCWCYVQNTNTNYNRIWELSSSDGIIGINFPNNEKIRLIWMGVTYDYRFTPRPVWIHVALVYQHKQSLVSLYINGVKVSSISKSLQTTAFNVFYIGQYTGGGNYRFKGSVDEFRIYNKVAKWTNNFYPPFLTDYNIENIKTISNPMEDFLWFNGNSSYACVYSGIDGLTVFTIELEFRTSDSGQNSKTNGSFKYIIGSDDYNNQEAYGSFGLSAENGKLFIYRIKSDSSVNYLTISDSYFTINDNKWHKVSMVSYSSGAFRLYLDGRYVSWTSVNLKLLSDKKMYIATKNWGYTDTSDYIMKFRQIRFWSKALTEEEIFADIDGTEEELEAWYKPDINGILKDFSSNNRDGIFCKNVAFYKYLYEKIDNSADIECNVINNKITSAKVFLPLETSPTEDIYNNKWTAIHSPIISNLSLKLDYTQKQFITMNNKIIIGGSNFNISFYFSYSGGTQTGPIFEIYHDESHFMTLNNDGWYLNYTKTDSMPTGRNYVEFIYTQANQTIYYYLNGILINSRETSIFSTSLKYIVNIGSNMWDNGYRNQFWDGSIEKFQINILPISTIKEIDDDIITRKLLLSSTSHISQYCNIYITIKNDKKIWKYYNQGTAEDLIIPGKTITKLTERETNTGIAFFQNVRKPCFNIPETKQVWIKFDLFHTNELTRFRVYDDVKHGSIANGLTLRSGSKSSVSLWAWDGINNAEKVYNTDAIEPYTRQTWMLQMISNETDGVLKLWRNGEMILSWNGNVNNGQPFKNIYMQSDKWCDDNITDYAIYTSTSHNLFSNVIISNTEIDIHENLCGAATDLVLNIRNNTWAPQKTLSIWLPFVSSPTEDLCGNQWISYLTPIIKPTNSLNGNVLYLNRTGYIKSTSTFKFKNQPFTISVEFSTFSARNLQMIYQLYLSDSQRIQLTILDNGKIKLYVDNGIIERTGINVIDGKKHYTEVSYDGTNLYFFLDGVKVGERQWYEQDNDREYSITIGARNDGTNQFAGVISNFKLYNNIILHNKRFDVPTYDEKLAELEKNNEIDFSYSVDINRKVENKNFSSEQYLKIWLPFDTSPTEDLCDNAWKVNAHYFSGLGSSLLTNDYPNYIFPAGNSLGQLYFNVRPDFNTARLDMTTPIAFSGGSFTIRLWMQVMEWPQDGPWDATSAGNFIFNITTDEGNSNIWTYFATVNSPVLDCSIGGITSYNMQIEFGKMKLIEFIYDDVKKKFFIYYDHKCLSQTDCTIHLGSINRIQIDHAHWTAQHFLGAFDEFQIYDGIAFFSNDVSPYDNTLEYSEKSFHHKNFEDELSFDLKADIIRNIINNNINSTLKAHLKFENGSIIDLCNNAELTIKIGSNSLNKRKPSSITSSCVYTNSSEYLQVKNVLNLNADEWTIQYWCYVETSSGENGFIEIGSSGQTKAGIQVASDGIWIASQEGGSWQCSTQKIIFPSIKQRWVHLEISKINNFLYFFEEGELVYTTQVNGLYDNGYINFGGGAYGTNNIMYFDDIKMYEGKALHRYNFNPVNAYIEENLLVSESVEFNLVADITRKVRNNYYTNNYRLQSYMPFDNIIAEDKCYNDLHIFGNPTLSKLYSFTNSSIKLNKEDSIFINHIIRKKNAVFYIDFWLYVDPSSDLESIDQIISIYRDKTKKRSVIWDINNQDILKSIIGTRVHIKIKIYNYYQNMLYINNIGYELPYYYLNNTRTLSEDGETSSYTIVIGKLNTNNSGYWGTEDRSGFNGYIDNFRIYSEYNKFLEGRPVEEDYTSINDERENKQHFFVRLPDITRDIYDGFNLAIWHNNEKILIPFRISEDIPTPRVVIYHNRKKYVNHLTQEDNKSNIAVYYNNDIYALSNK